MRKRRNLVSLHSRTGISLCGFENRGYILRISASAAESRDFQYAESAGGYWSSGVGSPSSALKDGLKISVLDNFQPVAKIRASVSTVAPSDKRMVFPFMDWIAARATCTSFPSLIVSINFSSRSCATEIPLADQNRLGLLIFQNIDREELLTSLFSASVAVHSHSCRICL